MDKHLRFARTEKGREELLGTGRVLKPRPRQVLFLIGEAISVAELKEKLPTCQELDKIVNQLWEDGFIGQVKSSRPHGTPPATPSQPDLPPLEAARELALRMLATLAGEHSPIFAHVKDAQGVESFVAAIASAKKILAAVASAAQASAFESSVLSLLGLPRDGDEAGAAQLNGVEFAKGRALEIIRSLVGDRSPVYAKIHGAHNRAEFVEAVSASKKVIAAVASSSHAQNFETEILSLLKND